MNDRLEQISSEGMDLSRRGAKTSKTTGYLVEGTKEWVGVSLMSRNLDIHRGRLNKAGEVGGPAPVATATVGGPIADKADQSPIHHVGSELELSLT